MEVQEKIGKLTTSTVFKEWNNKNKGYYLAHVFIMMDEANKNIWQVGFYNPEKERMVTFLITEGDIKHTEEQEVLKKEGTIEKLEINKIKINPEEALETAKKCFSEYKDIAIKEFFILQNAEEHNMYNITYFTQSLKTVNIKIDAETGKIIKHNMQKLCEFG